MNVIDLFCGCGGFSLGAHSAGLATTLAIDIDPILTSSFARNFPATKLVLGDLASVRGSALRRATGGPVDVVFGGPPCQAFSDIGRRSVDDPRRELLHHFFRIVAETRPAFFVMENVRGLGYADARDELATALDQVPGRYGLLGPVILNASEFGAATTRSRLFVIGYDPDRVDALELSDFDDTRRPPATVKDAIADLASAQSIGNDGDFDLWRIRSRARPSDYANRLRSRDGRFTGHQRTEHTRQVVRRFAKVPPGQQDPVGRHPRLDWTGQCPTLRAGTGSERGSYQSVRPIHPEENRVITVREAARLQGFPDKFRFHPTVWHSFRMIGNSVSPIIAKAIFRTILRKSELGPRRRIAAE
jgi:DNA (cytosine-5)-methyltransferase 1